MAADYLHVHGTPADAMRMMKDHGMWKGSRNRREMYRGALQLLADGAPIKPKEFPFIEHPPRMYEVEIGHPEESLLDWDKPFSAQPPGVMSAAERAGVYNRKWPRQELSVGEAIALRGDEFGRGELEENLFSAGIPGIKYFDGQSRRRGQGTRNYVMFPGTEDQIRILRKYGWMAPVAAGAASQYNNPNETPDPR
jgi:hypothetical protein